MIRTKTETYFAARLVETNRLIKNLVEKYPDGIEYDNADGTINHRNVSILEEYAALHGRKALYENLLRGGETIDIKIPVTSAN